MQPKVFGPKAKALLKATQKELKQTAKWAEHELHALPKQHRRFVQSMHEAVRLDRWAAADVFGLLSCMHHNGVLLYPVHKALEVAPYHATDTGLIAGGRLCENFKYEHDQIGRDLIMPSHLRTFAFTKDAKDYAA